MLLDSIPFTFPPCDEAAAWAAAQPSAEAAWATCERPDWMIWALGHLPGDPFDREIRQIACDLARSVLRLAGNDDRPRLAVEAAEACLRDPSPATRAAAADAADAAAAAARAAWAAREAGAARAAWAAAEAARAAAWAADAAEAAAAAAARAAAWAAREAGAGTGCDAIRARVPWDLLKSALDARAGER